MVESYPATAIGDGPIRHTPLLKIPEWSSVRKGTPLLNHCEFPNPPGMTVCAALVALEKREFRVHNQPGYLRALAGRNT
jgi:hypothetical protein